MEEKFFVYIIYNIENDKFYIGQTNNLRKRIKEHNCKEENKYTSKFLGRWTLVYKEVFFSRREAKIRENFLKKQKNKDFYKRICKENHSVA